MTSIFKRHRNPEIKPETIPSLESSSRIESITWENFTWVNITSPTQHEIDWLTEKYQFHPLTLDDCLSRKQISKLDVYPGYIFFVFHYPLYHKETRIAVKRQWSAYIGENYIVTVHTEEMKPIIALFRDCQQNEESRREYFSGGSGFLLYRLLDRSIDAYFPVLDKILSLLENIEDAVFDEEVEAAREISVLRRDVITQRAVFFPTRDIFVEMENKLKRFSTTDLTPYYNDLMDHINRICNTLNEAKEIIEVFSDADFRLGTDRVNRILRVLNILATIALPFLVVTSLYGMNVILPGGLEGTGRKETFAVILAVSALCTVLMLFYFHRRRWI
jgi:magnesium transporter